MQTRILAFLASAAIAAGVAGCSPAGAGVAARAIPIVMTDAMVFEPATVTVGLGDSVTFNVKNAGQIAHEFFVGNGTAQDEHEVEMHHMSAVGHDHATGVYVEAGDAKALTITFVHAGTLLMGCHEPGHWGAGMKGTIIVGP